MPQRPVHPSNAILVNGNPIIEEYEVQTATDMYPGRLVIPGTGTHQVVVATDNATNVIGVLDVEATERRSTQYGASDQARVLRGDAVVLLLALHSATITKGMKVQCAGSGKIDQYATVNAAVGVAEESFGPAAADTWIMVKLTLV